MSIKSQLFKSTAGIFSFTFLILSTISFLLGEFIFGLTEGGNSIYFSIFFIAISVLSTIFMTIMLLRSEKKFFLYVLFGLPMLGFCIFRLIDIIQPFSNVLWFIMLAVSVVFLVSFLIATVFSARQGALEVYEKKREEIVTSVLDSQDRYREALEKKKEKWEKTIEEE